MINASHGMSCRRLSIKPIPHHTRAFVVGIPNDTFYRLKKVCKNPSIDAPSSS